VFDDCQGGLRDISITTRAGTKNVAGKGRGINRRTSWRLVPVKTSPFAYAQARKVPAARCIAGREGHRKEEGLRALEKDTGSGRLKSAASEQVRTASEEEKGARGDRVCEY